LTKDDDVILEEIKRIHNEYIESNCLNLDEPELLEELKNQVEDS